MQAQHPVRLSSAPGVLALWGPRLLGLCLLIGLIAPAMGQSYSARGKRDPFRDLAASRQQARPQIVEPPPFSQRPPGLSGLLISEVSVVGTAATNDQRIAILHGTDNFTYMAREGAKLFDGYIEKITTDEVVFVREVFDTSGKKTTSKVVKRSS